MATDGRGSGGAYRDSHPLGGQRSRRLGRACGLLTLVGFGWWLVVSAKNYAGTRGWPVEAMGTPLLGGPWPLGWFVAAVGGGVALTVGNLVVGLASVLQRRRRTGLAMMALILNVYLLAMWALMGIWVGLWIE